MDDYYHVTDGRGTKMEFNERQFYYSSDAGSYLKPEAEELIKISTAYRKDNNYPPVPYTLKKYEQPDIKSSL